VYARQSLIDERLDFGQQASPTQIVEISAIGSDEMAALVMGRNCMLRIWEVSGRLSGFK
jgi:hypothetical protein